MYKVIIIEDDPMVASINKQYVELTSSFHVEATFKNGILALQYLQNCTVDLIILDYYTPQMNGDEFIDQLHAAGMTPAIIMVTSANDAETVRRLISRGVTDYLVKPFEYDRFKAALERFAKRQEELKTSASASDLGQAEIDRLKAELDSQKDAYQRMLAEYANYKRRTEQEKERIGEFTKADLLKHLLTSVDNMERAIEAADGPEYKKGVDMTFRQFHETLVALGLEEIPAKDTPFNPEVHNAVMREDADGVEPDTVTEVFQKGYRLGERVLRPAMVKVAN